MRDDSLPRSARAIICIAFGGGVLVAAAEVVALVRTPRPTGFTVLMFVVLAGVLAFTWVRPIVMYRDNESGAFHPDEGFLVLMLLLLPRPWTVVAFALSVATAQIVRRRSLVKSMFNWGQVVVSVGLAAAFSSLIGAPSSKLGIAEAGAAVLGALVFAVANGLWMAAIVTALGTSWRKAVLDGWMLRLRVLGASIILGVTIALAVSTHPWSFAVAVLALVILHRILAGHFQSRHDRTRLLGLFKAALEANRFLQERDVVTLILGSARQLLRCPDAALTVAAPRTGQLGAEMSVNGERRWLVVSGREPGEPYDAADVELLDALAAIGTGALKNASLYQEIREQQERLAAITSSVGEGVCALDDQGQVTFLNPAAELMLGSRFDDGHAVAPGFLAGPAAEVIHEGTVVRNEGATFRRHSGESFPVALTASAIRRTGQPVGAVIVFRDISERQELERTRSRLVGFLDASPDLVALSDREGRISYMNPSGRAMLGLGPSETLDEYEFADFYVPSWTKVMSAVVAATVSREGVWRGESAMVDRSGRELTVHQVVVAHYGADGHVDYISTTARDISELRRLQDQLFQSQKLQALGQLAGGVAHDFNNVLAVVSLCAEQLAARVEGESRAFVAEIAAAAQRATDLTDQLLLFSRRQPVEVVAVDPADVIISMQHMLSRLIGENITMTTIVAEARGCRVNVDRGRLEQVIMNLALNGRDAMPAGGALTILAQRVTAAGVEIPGSPVAEYVKISVSDTGAGMTAQTQARVFEPFFTTKPRGQGTGLGLATVQGIVAQSGGDVTVHSRVGQGTTFTVHLPLVKSPGKNVDVGDVAPAANARHRGGTVLLVEDEAAVRRAEAMVLESAGYRVLQASDGVEGLEVAARFQDEIAIVITDVLMPKLSGPDLVHCLATLRPRTKVLFTSGYTGNATEDGRIGTEDTVLAKPFTAGGLLAAVSGVLRRPAPLSGRNGGASPEGQAPQSHHQQDGDNAAQAEPERRSRGPGVNDGSES